jgi:hypothetical protein
VRCGERVVQHRRGCEVSSSEGGSVAEGYIAEINLVPLGQNLGDAALLQPATVERGGDLLDYGDAKRPDEAREAAFLPRSEKCVDGRLQVLDGATGAELAGHRVQPGEGHEEEGVDAEGLVKIADTAQEDRRQRGRAFGR